MRHESGALLSYPRQLVNRWPFEREKDEFLGVI